MYDIPVISLLGLSFEERFMCGGGDVLLIEFEQQTMRLNSLFLKRSKVSSSICFSFRQFGMKEENIDQSILRRRNF